MKQYIIYGGKQLSGEVYVSGAKNAALPVIAAAIIPNEPVVLKNIPEVSDVYYMLDALRELGATVSEFKNNTVTINGSSIKTTTVSAESMRKIRASYYLIGALLARNGKAKVPMPGGCSIGNRPIDLHLKGFRKLGAKISISHGNVVAKTEGNDLLGTSIFMDTISVGATINIMLAASRASGITTIINAAKEPHVADVANMLRSMGVKIEGIGTDRIRIHGTKNIHGTKYTIIPDQIEASTYMIAAAATKSKITIKGTEPLHLTPIIEKLTEAGCAINIFGKDITITGPKTLKPTNIVTNPHPGFPTDCQPQITAALSMCKKDDVCVVKENIFSGRFGYVAELVRMGADIKVYDQVAVITGIEKLQGTTVEPTDLRAGAALIIAGLMAEGQTIINNVHFIERGYDKIDKKLKGLGADIELIEIPA